MENKKTDKKIRFNIITSLTKEEAKKNEKATLKRINDYAKKLIDGLPSFEKMNARVLSIKHITESQNWKQFWSLLVKIFEEEGEDLGEKNYVPLKMEFENYLYDELYSDYLLYQSQRKKIKKGFFETKYFVFDTVRNSFKPKSTEIENYLINLLSLPARFFEAFESKNKNMSLIIDELKNKRRTFNYNLMLKTKKIETESKNSIPKPTQIECILLANKLTKSFNENDLIDENRKPKELLLNIRDSYKAQKKTL